MNVIAKDDMPIERAITEFRFAYGKHSHLKSIAPPPNSVGLSVVPDQVAGFFEQAFAETGARAAGRPTAGDWWEALESLEARMRRCGSDPVHSYYSGLAACPWCRLEENSGLLLFLSADRITKIDLRREWQKVEAITPPGPVARINPGDFPHRPVPLSPGMERSLAFRSIRQVAGMVVIAVCTVLALGGMIADYLTVMPVAVVVLALFLYPGEAAGEKRRRITKLDNARYLWELWNRKWTAEAGDAAFHAQLVKLRGLKGKFESIDRGYRAGLLALERTVKDRQQKKFLEGCSIDKCMVPRVGDGMKKVLKSAGIRSAADITPAALRVIPHLDNNLTNDLLAWRERTERNFLFDPAKGTDRSDLQALVHKYQPMMKPVEREIQQGIGRLGRVQADILKKRVTLRPEVEKRARELAQAEADTEVFSHTPEELILQEVRGIFRLGKQ